MIGKTNNSEFQPKYLAVPMNIEKSNTDDTNIVPPRMNFAINCIFS